ncbi:DNA repair protein RadC [Chitinophaga eiseniae]|uniref:DNA repair protein RadC n=1 Tax=Chitinophaga eiseniae TaxID=634771 RepID=A0A1T4SXA9_9BACT|nr:JAB domain-containing protein [Chitinophaga eiseniae]SKA32772.1 DNA repair protein RadC [Chitinophaga eiseniae]
METQVKLTAKVPQIQLRYRPKIKAADRVAINGSKEANDIFRANWNEDTINLQEQFKILLLDAGSRVIGIVQISSGGTTCTVADPRLIFAAALKAGAKKIILAHNHPSGSLLPSADDKRLTEKLVHGGRLLEIEVIDHLILAWDGHYSFCENGLM